MSVQAKIIKLSSKAEKDRNVKIGSESAIRQLARKGDPDDDFEFAVGTFVERFSRPERLPHMLPIFQKLPGLLFWRAFGASWHDFYDTWPHRHSLLRLLRRHSHCSPARKLDECDPVMIYRGCNRRRVRGVSWTTEREIAEQFAAGHLDRKVPNPVVLTAIIDRPNVFEYIPEHDEAEVLIDPTKVTELRIEPAPHSA